MTDVNNKKPRKNTSTNFVWIVSVVALLLSALSFYATQRNQTISKQARLKDNQLSSHLQTEVKMLTEVQEKSVNANLHLQKELQRLIKENDIERNNWQLLKALHLLETAQTTLKWDKALQPTIFLLEKADSLLASPVSVDTTAVRKQINQVVVSLKAIPIIDTVGLLSKIDGISHALRNCRLKIENSNLEHKDETAKKNESSKSKWQKTLDTSLNKLSKLVVIRYRKDKKAPLISLHEKALIVKRIQLSLSEAKWAIIRQNQRLYNYSLKHALLEIEDAFDAEDITTKSITTSLEELRKEAISSSTINLRPMIKSLDKLIQGEKS